MVLVGVDTGTFTPSGATGGAETVDIRHSHTSGTLGTDSDSHTHGPGTLGTDNDSHTHDAGSGLSIGASSSNHNTETFGTPDQNLAKSNHSHTLSGETESDSHNHSVTSGVTASDNHSHNVDSGSTANALSTTQSILPPYLVGTWLQRTS